MNGTTAWKLGFAMAWQSSLWQLPPWWWTVGLTPSWSLSATELLTKRPPSQATPTKCSGECRWSGCAVRPARLCSITSLFSVLCNTIFKRLYCHHGSITKLSFFFISSTFMKLVLQFPFLVTLENNLIFLFFACLWAHSEWRAELGHI